MKVIRLSILVILAFTILSAHARMYQWVDPASKITQLSGKPPVWYRSKKGGPRVIVFENNRVVDDTNIRVSDVEQEALRRQAFLETETSRKVAREKLVQAKRLEAMSEQTEGDETQAAPKLTPPAVQADKAAPVVNSPEPPPVAATNAAMVNRMRQLIQEWENKNAASARAVIKPGTPVSR